MNDRYSHYTQSFSEKNYPSASELFHAAVNQRNIKLGALASTGLPAKLKMTVDESFKMMQDQYPDRLAMKNKLFGIANI